MRVVRDLAELKVGDPVVHAQHGIGRYMGLVSMDLGEGETEFLHQQRKIAPKTGTLLIAPTAFTHTHRGNMPKGGDKYIATSWILFQRGEALYRGAPAP